MASPHVSGACAVFVDWYRDTSVAPRPPRGFRHGSMNLDLMVTAADVTSWMGNVFAGGASTTGGEADRKNNIENVFLSAPSAGSYRVTVSAANIIGDGLPNLERPTDQDFALVVTNAQVVPEETFVHPSESHGKPGKVPPGRPPRAAS